MPDNYKQLTHTAEEIDKAVDLANANATEVYALKNYAMVGIQGKLNDLEKNKADAETVEELKEDIEKLNKEAEDVYKKSEVDEKLNDKVEKIEGKGLSANDFSDEYKNKINKNAEDLENTYSKSEVDEKIGDKVDKIEGKGLSTNDFDNKYKSKVDDTYSKSEVDSKVKDKVDKVEGKSLSTNDFTDDYQKRVHDAYAKAAESISEVERLKSSKADKTALDETNATVAANKENLQGQIDALVLEAGGDSNPEVVQARIGLDGTNFETLKSRLDKTDAVSLDLKNDTKELSDDFGNLADFRTKVQGKFINGNDGKEYSQESFSYITIPVKPGEKYSINLTKSGRQIAFFNDETFVSGLVDFSDYVVAPYNCNIAKISFNNSEANTMRITKNPVIKKSSLSSIIVDSCEMQKEYVVSGKYVAYDSGKVTSQSVYSYVRLNVEPEKMYVISGDNEKSQIAFFSGTNHVSGILNPKGRILIPPDVDNMTLSFNSNYLDTITFERENVGCIKEELINDNNVWDKIKHLLMETNLLNINERIIGKYVRYDNGQIYTQSVFSYVELSVEPNTDYYVGGDNKTNQIAFFDDSGTYISGILNGSGKFKTPENATKLTLSFSNKYFDTICICRRNEDEIFGAKIKNGYLDIDYIKSIIEDNNVIEKTIDQSGNGDFTTIAAAMEYASTNASKKIRFTVKSGTYQEVQMNIHGNFELIGENKDSVIIIGDGSTIAEEYPSHNNRHIFMNVETKSLKAKFENLTLIGKDVKYCFHFDAYGGGLDVLIKNCNMTNDNPAVGCGLWSGQSVIVKDCTIKYDRTGTHQKWACGLFTHNWTDQTKESYFEADNVKVIDASLMEIQCLDSGHKDTVKVKNCTSSMYGNCICIDEYSVGSSGSINLECSGGKYSIVYSSDYENSTFHQEGLFDTYVYNASDTTIDKHCACKYDITNASAFSRKCVNRGTASDYDGVALQSIAPGEYGLMALRGRVIDFSGNGNAGTNYTFNENGEITESSTAITAVSVPIIKDVVGLYIK